MRQKKLMLLGGSAQQVVAIDTAKRLGYATVLCDYLPDNPGQYHADTFYQVSTTDRAAVLEVAQKEKIDGIVAYASDPAAPTAAYVAERMGLPGNPVDAVETLCNKDRFRVFLEKNGFHAPKSGGYAQISDALVDIDRFSLPVIVKPVDSSGSKGATVLRSWDKLEEALRFAFSFSRSKRIIIEEYIEKKHPYLIGGDVFVTEGKICLWGLMNCHRDERVNPLVPVGKSYPLLLDTVDETAVRNTLQRMVEALGIRCGTMNVELVVDAAGKVWPIDVGPRNGGNMIPELLSYIFSVDVVEMTIRAAMGQQIPIINTEGKGCFATHNLHSVRNGCFSDIRISKELSPYVFRRNIYKRPGEKVEYFDNAAKAVGIMFLEFQSKDVMMRMLGEIHNHVCVELL